MSDAITISQKMTRFDVSPKFLPYSKVVIRVSDETVYEAGNETGRTLEIDNPFGSQQIADNILEEIAGFQYQPYEGSGASLDPAAEMGDGVNMPGTYGGIYRRDRKFSRLMQAYIAAPYDEEIDHEYQFESPKDRQYKRSIGNISSKIDIKASEILAEVVKQEDGDTESFGWSLTSDAHRWYANGQEVMAITASGLKVTGEVEAGTGKIGNFNISATAIWNNIPEFGSSQNSGVYIGTDGIQLGQNFKVDASGNTTIKGSLTVGDDTITANNLRLGASRANSGYSTWNGTTTAWNNATTYRNGYGPSGIWINGHWLSSQVSVTINGTSYTLWGSRWEGQ